MRLLGDPIALGGHSRQTIAQPFGRRSAPGDDDRHQAQSGEQGAAAPALRRVEVRPVATLLEHGSSVPPLAGIRPGIVRSSAGAPGAHEVEDPGGEGEGDKCEEYARGAATGAERGSGRRDEETDEREGQDEPHGPHAAQGRATAARHRNRSPVPRRASTASMTGPG